MLKKLLKTFASDWEGKFILALTIAGILFTVIYGSMQ